MSITVLETIQLRRGLKANLPVTGSLGEPFFCTDTGELFVWNGSSMVKVGGSGGVSLPILESDVTNLVTDLASVLASAEAYTDSHSSGLPIGNPSILRAGVTSFNALGDSITAGYGLPLTVQAYCNLVVRALGAALSNNFAIYGANMAGIIPQAYALTPSAPVGSIALVGANDVGPCITSSYIPIYVSAVQAMLVWLGLLPSQIVLETGMTFAGAWNGGAGFGLGAQFSNTPNSTASAVVHGTTVYVAGLIYSNLTTAFDILVDGVTVGSFSGLISSGGLYPFCYRFAGLAPGAHTVTMKITGSDYGTIQWMAGNQSAGTKPVVIVGNTLPESANDATIRAMNSALATITAGLVADGLLVYPVDSYSALTQGATPTQFLADNSHPNAMGHALITEKFLNSVYVSSAAAGLTAQSVIAMLEWFLSLPNYPIIVDAPSSAGANGTAGMMAFDATHFYLCVSQNNWVRVALASW